jgi:nitroreductase
VVIVDIVDRRSVRSALELACRAPSIHNSQPWRWRLSGRSVHLYADLSRWLPATDADGRDLVVSCGAALHHLGIALAATGIAATVHRLPNPDDPVHLAAIELRNGTPTDADLALATAIMRRRTDRRRYCTWDVPARMVDELVAHAAAHGAVLRPISEPHARAAVVAAIRTAAEIQESSAAYVVETALWSGRSAAVDGVPATNLLRDPAGTARRFSPGLIEQPDTGEPDGAQLLVLGSTSDDTLAQLRTGEALSAVLLHATASGLGTCPLSQPLEVGDTRRHLRDNVLGGTLLPQLVLRIGWPPSGPPLPATPRRPVADVIDTHPR